ncbi:hypothetical protein AS026_19510 [Rhizobium altiplani]|uniref:Uncharacterized protein n=2 Tax=Rhizobium altiplani TaxID=1864509 RepID=A0A109J7N0_9HYPH|nr:hypothetical protein AS026_19510 [Rhizobium altiplani]
MRDFTQPRDARDALERFRTGLALAEEEEREHLFVALERDKDDVDHFRPKTAEQWAEDGPKIIRYLDDFANRSPHWLAFEWDAGFGHHRYIKKIRSYYGGIDMVWANFLEKANLLNTHFMFVCFSERCFAQRFRLDHEIGRDYRIDPNYVRPVDS